MKKKSFKLVIQVNGKTRDVVEAKAGISGAEVKELALSSPKIQKWLRGNEITKSFYIKDKLLNLLTK